VVCAILLVSCADAGAVAGALALLQALFWVVLVCLDAALACVAVVFALLLLSGGMLLQALLQVMLQVMLRGLLARCGGIGRGGLRVCDFGGRRGASGT
jgi:hypothetical protein